MRGDEHRLKEAERLVRASSAFTYLLTRLLFPAVQARRFYLWYAYFRWLDDRVDAPGQRPEQRTRIVREQREFFESLYRDGAPVEPVARPMEYLRLLVEGDRALGSPLRSPISKMIQAIEYDARRIGTGRLCPREELLKFQEMEVSAYLETFQYFCNPEAAPGLLFPPAEGIAGKTVHVLRDLRDDVSEGIVNVSLEDRAAYEIDLDDLDGSGARLWIEAQARQAAELFRQGKALLSCYPSWRYRVAVSVLCAKYERILASIEAGGFRVPTSTAWGKRAWLHFLARATINVVRCLWGGRLGVPGEQLP